jgi:hypothetical protein
MKRPILAILIVALTGTAALFAQGGLAALRAGRAADDLKRATSRLADRTLQDIVRGGNNSRNEIRDAMLAQQTDAGAGLVLEMVRNRRPDAELSDAVAELTDLMRRAPAFSTQTALWRDVRTALDGLAAELDDRGGRGRGNTGRPIIGRVSWRGRIDDRAQLIIKGRTIEVKTITGQPNPPGTSNFTSPLPASPVTVDVTKLAGRGTVTVLQQPARANDFTAVIEINDDRGGNDDYRLDIFWR